MLKADSFILQNALPERGGKLVLIFVWFALDAGTRRCNGYVMTDEKIRERAAKIFVLAFTASRQRSGRS
jgi:hypothetical protein